MLTLMLIPQHFQMDWNSLDPKADINNKVDTEVDKDACATSNAVQNASSNHIELVENKGALISQNGKHSEESNISNKSVTIAPDQIVGPCQPQSQLEVKVNEMSPQDKNEIATSSENSAPDVSPAHGSAAKPNVPQVMGGAYDVESINTILKTVQYNSFINSSIIKTEVKKEEIKVEDEELLKTTQTNGQGTITLKRGPVLVDNGNWQKRIKQETTPIIATEFTDVDIEAELPCTSIQLKKKPRQRKKGKVEEVKADNEIKIENTDEKPVRVLKPCSKRSTKRKTNYREASSDEEPKFIASSRSRPNNRVAKAELKKILEESANVSSDKISPIKSEQLENKIDLEIKREPTDIQNEIELKKDEDVVAVSTTDLSIKTETQQEIKLTNGVEITSIDSISASATGTKPESETKIESTVKEEGTPGNDIKEETNEDVPKKAKIVRNPAATRKKKPRRLRHTFSSTTTRNKTRLHPLTRQEQQMMNTFMETKEPFLQKIPCLKLSSKISKCRECRCASIRSDSVFCRFYDFRRLRYKDKGVLVVDGFSDPNKDPGPHDIETWMLGPPPRDIDLDISRYILMHVGDQFCRIWQEEQTAIDEHMSPNKTIAWKKVVKGVREICDVCEATLFNFHWTCNKCGFGVCLDCYRDRKNKKIQKAEKPLRGCDEYGWILCAMRDPHEMVKLMLTQIIPGNALNFLAHRLHQACKLWKIPQKCGCPLSSTTQAHNFEMNSVELADKTIRDTYLRFYSRECEIKYLNKIKKLDPQNPSDCFSFVEAETELIEESKNAGTLSTVLSTTLKHLKLEASSSSKNNIAKYLQDDVTKEYNFLLTQKRTQKALPQKVMTMRASEEMFPGIAHDWLCNGKLLRLLDSRDPRNALLFKEAWKRGQPIMVSELCKFLNISLWHPEAFCKDFGDKKNDLINCMTGNLVPNQPMKLFWEGFQCVSKRLLDANGQPMLLKLKDWPPGDDFAEILPTRFRDLMSALPLPEYTLRTGGLNIASRLPSIFVPPDLGPKMYNAYGSALHPDKGTTNLHLDISDAVNIMVYVGIPTDASAKDQIRAALSAIDSGGCDILTRRRVRQPGVMPGALWHIYSARDADKIRDLLNRVTIERGFRLEPDHDPIHDQNWYLDNELRERLYDDYGVEGYPIAQCLGDAVFIPAGAPHQVRNLHNCIKVAEDFVSPENIQHCFHLSQQFRKLSMSHTNHEDKLQIRNVIYHSIKDTTAYLTYLLNQII
ncbi:lysine-specific demethylase 3A isoform X1 [Eupeodes corollae]|uniref:lysine-specific demethylase 3A isoform X1 n=1 Tax=Eupeodes corollae TaxID=290404 RepID=UPI0024925740|nr:lysine-specific demethylase 3A isoform X1 [Eupeodes corollae]